jgi:hypothetical protein
MLIKLEYPSKLILMLMRADGNEILNKINEMYHIEESHNTTDAWNSYYILYHSLCKILDKFKTAILAEGSSLKFSQDSELLNIINKIVVDKNNLSMTDLCQMKENKVFNTDTEKFIILTINQYDPENSEIFNN